MEGTAFGYSHTWKVVVACDQCAYKIESASSTANRILLLIINPQLSSCVEFLLFSTPRRLLSLSCVERRLLFLKSMTSCCRIFCKSNFLNHRLRHRGPDWSGYRLDEKTHSILCHERLAIVGNNLQVNRGYENSILLSFTSDLQHGAQPVTNEDETIWLAVNGEIYNRNSVFIEFS